MLRRVVASVTSITGMASAVLSGTARRYGHDILAKERAAKSPVRQTQTPELRGNECSGYCHCNPNARKPGAAEQHIKEGRLNSTHGP